jgi:DNA repair exonuclease SbcCD ATPase subunit
MDDPRGAGGGEGDGAVLQKRLGQEQDEAAEQTGLLTAAETMRAALSGKPPEKKDDEKVSLFWRLFGGTILSITALVAITLFNNISGTISDLRAEVGREREARAGLAKKDEIDTRMKTLYDRTRAVEAFKPEIEAIKERTGANAATVEAVRKDIGTSVDGLKKDVAAVDVLKEKVSTLTADLKAARGEVQRLQQDVEKNKLADLERKAFRDAQAKQLDETIKELNKGLQDCREKLARLEGVQPKTDRTAPAKTGPEAKPVPVETPDE